MKKYAHYYTKENMKEKAKDQKAFYRLDDKERSDFLTEKKRIIPCWTPSIFISWRLFMEWIIHTNYCFTSIRSILWKFKLSHLPTLYN